MQTACGSQEGPLKEQEKASKTYHCMPSQWCTSHPVHWNCCLSWLLKNLHLKTNHTEHLSFSMCLLKALLSCFKSCVRACRRGGMAEMWPSSQSAMRAVTWCTANLSHNGQESGTHTWQLKDDSFKKKENGFPRIRFNFLGRFQFWAQDWRRKCFVTHSFKVMTKFSPSSTTSTCGSDADRCTWTSWESSPKTAPSSKLSRTASPNLCAADLRKKHSFKIQNKTVRTIKLKLGNHNEGTEMTTWKSAQRTTSSSTNESESASKLRALKNRGSVKSASRLHHLSLQFFCEGLCTLSLNFPALTCAAYLISDMNPGSDSEWQTLWNQPAPGQNSSKREKAQKELLKALNEYPQQPMVKPVKRRSL